MDSLLQMILGHGITGLQPGGLRPDMTQKGKGFFGPLARDDGISTELSFDFDQGGKNYLAPLLVPTLSKDELYHLLSGKEPTPEIYTKAIQYAMQRTLSGKPTFANPLEIFPLPK